MQDGQTMVSNAEPVRDSTAARAASFAATLAPAWPRVRRWLLPLFAIAVLGLLLSNAHKVDWAGAWQAVKRYPPGLLLQVLVLTIASHWLYGCFDLIGRLHTRHRLPVLQTWAIAVTSYAFTLNLGSLVGGVATRARLYSKAGLDEVTIAQVLGLSVATNWLGYGLVAGGLFAAGVIVPPARLHLGAGTLQALGVVMMGLAAGYVLACARARGNVWQVRGRQVRLPSARRALVQLAFSASNWALMGAAMYLLLRGQVAYGTVLGVLMAASIAGVVTPIPAGLGVLEAVYLALLSGSVRQGALMGAVLAYRALYYLLPMAAALLMYLLLERRAAARQPAPAGERPQPPGP